MTQRKLLIGALALTFAIGGLFFVASNPALNASGNNKFKPENCATPKYAKEHKNKCKKQPSSSPSPTASPTSGTTTSPAPTNTPSPTSQKEPIAFVQFPFEVGYPNPPKVPGNLTPPINPLRLDQLDNLADSKNTSYFEKLVGAFSGRRTMWNQVLINNILGSKTTASPTLGVPVGIRLVGLNTGKDVQKSYLISLGLATSESGTTLWQSFRFRYKAKNEKQLLVSYRIADSITTDPSAADWQSVSLDYGKKEQDFTKPLGQSGRYFQYKINIKGIESYVDNLALVGVPVASPVDLPSPTPTPSVSPPVGCKPAAVSPAAGVVANDCTPAPNGEGKLTITTKKIVLNASPSPSTQVSGGPILPQNSPSPTPAPTPSQICFGLNKNEDIANITLSLRQTEGGSVKIEDQQTDSDGIWQGKDGEVDTIPAGTWEIKFGDFDAQNYKLVAFCDPDNAHIVRSQSDPLQKKATIQVVNGQTSRLIALYGLRNAPYISMNKYAIPDLTPTTGQKAKVVRVTYPGMKYAYLIRYTNTGGEAAKNLVIRDVIPEQLAVDETIGENADSNIQLAPDPRGGTLVTATIGDLAAGATGTISIPVTMKADAFTNSGVLAP